MMKGETKKQNKRKSIYIFLKNKLKRFLNKKAKMGRQYSREPTVAKKSCKAKGSDLRTHFKNTFEVVRAIKGMTV